ncbi:YqaA family protein [Balneatrix alpica]|uniref:YqaA family protein n=1 Tax=Balneatrix alpica TaxID=75684 RepID=A0ABV5Z6V6_9GAMM|nr:VTT domain-containing protein [Balneatrix alpica]
MSLGLLGLFVTAMLAATLLPGGSEIALVAWLQQAPEQWWQGWLAATLGNSLGSLITLAMGRGLAWGVMRQRQQPAQLSRWQQQAVNWLQRYGHYALFWSWLPLVGDALPLAAGWLGLPWGRCAFWILLGKGVRYAVLLLGLGYFLS